MLKQTAIIAGILTLAGCSTIIEGRSQEIMINTSPAGASCKLTRNNQVIGTVTPTPSSIYIEKTKYDITISCSKAGYEDATYLNKSDVAGATVGNVLAGGVIGWAVDSSTGADNKYETPVNITLAKK